MRLRVSKYDHQETSVTLKSSQREARINRTSQVTQIFEKTRPLSVQLGPLGELALRCHDDNLQRATREAAFDAERAARRAQTFMQLWPKGSLWPADL